MNDKTKKHLNSLIEFDYELSKTEFDEICRTTSVGIVYDSKDLDNRNMVMAIELGVNLLSRLYKNICIFDISINHDKTVFEDIGNKISNEINFYDDIQDSSIIINLTKTELEDINSIYLRTSNWDVEISRQCDNDELEWGPENPLSALFGITLAVGEVFKEAFPKIKSNKIEHLAFSLFNYSKEIGHGPIINEIYLDDFVKIGIGAVGNAFIYALSKFKQLKGGITLVDKEVIDESNTQRYILSSLSNIGDEKVKVAMDSLSTTKLKVQPYRKTLGEYIYDINPDSIISNLVVSVDNFEGRVHSQSLLPKNIFNAYTGDKGILGVSSHQFGNGPCLACLYTRKTTEKSDIELIAEWLGVSDTYIGNIMLNHLENVKPIFTKEIATTVAKESTKKITMEQLSPFIGMEFDAFTTKAMCGEMLLMDEGTVIATEHSPVAHQSVLSGILLATEVIKFAVSGNKICDRRQVMMNILDKPNDVFMTREIHRKLNTCICTDDVYISVYKKKYESVT